MYSFIAFLGILACTHGLPLYGGRVDVEEDTLGNYKFDYNTDTASRTEQRFEDGRVVGSYSFVDPHSVTHTVHYVAGPHQGFSAQSADIPQSVQEPWELAKQRNDHFVILNTAKSIGSYGATPVHTSHVLPYFSELPHFASLPVGYVPHVDAEHHAAQVEHFAAHAQALSRLAQEYRRV